MQTRSAEFTGGEMTMTYRIDTGGLRPARTQPGDVWVSVAEAERLLRELRAKAALAEWLAQQVKVAHREPEGLLSGYEVTIPSLDKRPRCA
jgi:hypothetical protein